MTVKRLLSLAIVLLLALPWRLEAGQRTMTNNVVVGDAIDGITPAVEGATNTYVFAPDSLDMAGYKIYYNAGQRHLILTNLTDLTDSGGTAIIDTSRAAEYQDASFAKIYAGSRVALGGYITTAARLTKWGYIAGDVVVSAPSIAISGTNSYGLSIDSRSGGKPGGSVTLWTTNVTLVGGIGTDGDVGAGGFGLGGAITVHDGSGGPARVAIGGSVTSVGRGGGAVTLVGTDISVSNINTRSTYESIPAGAVTLSATGTVAVGGFITTINIGHGGAVSITAGDSITVAGTTNGIGIETRSTKNSGAYNAGNITIVSSNGDITVTGGFNASAFVGTRRGTISLSATNGGITVGSLDANLFMTISIQAAAGRPVYVTGAITNFSVSEDPKKITFPAGSAIGNDVFYLVTENTAIPLSGTYAIFSGTNDTGRLLKQVQDQGSLLMVW